MWMNLVAGVLNYPTTSRPADTIDQRLGVLRDALAKLQTYRNAQRMGQPGPKWQNYDGRPSMILVAPEYMFLNEGYVHPSNRDELRQNRFMEAADHLRVVSALQAISAGYGKQLVFVPGSIASRIAIPTDAAGAGAAIASAKDKVRTGASYIQGQLVGASEDSREEFGEAGKFLGAKARSPAMKLHGLDQMLARNDRGLPCYLASNVAYMFHAGRPVATYNKRADFHEVLPRYNRMDTVYIPGIKPGRATVGGINFGIEICLDHVYGVLQNAPTVTGTRPRIHLICSAAVDSEPPNLLVQNGGYIMHASTSGPSTHILRLLNGLREIDVVEQPVGAGRLRMGLIEIEHHGL